MTGVGILVTMGLINIAVKTGDKVLKYFEDQKSYATLPEPKKELNNALRFTILGSSGSGKTTMLASMYHAIEDLRAGIFHPTNSELAYKLEEAYNKLQIEANQASFVSSVKSAEEKHEYAFTLFGNTQTHVKFYECPSEWLNSAKSYKKVIDILKKSICIFVLIDTPYLMEENGIYKSHAHIDAIATCIMRSLEDNEFDKLIIIIPMKCEKYTQNPDKVKKFRYYMSQACQKIIGLKENPLYKDHLSMALMPIWTMGNFIFDKFVFQKNNSIPRVMYKRIAGKHFSPADVDQPLRLMIYFFITQLIKALKSGKTMNDFVKFADFFIDNSQKFQDDASFIIDGMRTDDPKFVIYENKTLTLQQGE